MKSTIDIFKWSSIFITIFLDLGKYIFLRHNVKMKVAYLTKDSTPNETQTDKECIAQRWYYKQGWDKVGGQCE